MARPPTLVAATAVAATCLMAGCDPIFDISGAFFPAWLVAAVLGVVATIVVRGLLVRLRLEAHLGWPTLAYLGFFTMTTLGVWLWLFST
jgi:hypothetical protein